jgi:hypothetical protein
VLDVLANPPFVTAHPGSQRGRLRGIRYAVDWLAAQPGTTWQQRWLASGAEASGPGWKQTCILWLDSEGIRVRQRLDLLSLGLNVMVCADLVRPSLLWLAASGISAWALARNLQASRDPDGFARLRRACEADVHVTTSARQATMGRAAILVAAKGGTLGDVTAGDFLELLDVETQLDGRPPRLQRHLVAAHASDRHLRPGRPGRAGRAANCRPAQPRRTHRPLPAGLPTGA